MKLAIVGSRTFRDYDLLNSCLKNNVDKITVIISGGAKGADYLAEKFAKENNIPIKVFLPDWDKYGKSAGFIRNKQIVNEADSVIAFWDGVSKGTTHSIMLAEQLNKKIKVVYF